VQCLLSPLLGKAPPSDSRFPPAADLLNRFSPPFGPRSPAFHRLTCCEPRSSCILLEQNQNALCSSPARIGALYKGQVLDLSSGEYFRGASMTNPWRLLVGISFAALVASDLPAQSIYGTLTGIVSDPSSAVVAGAKIKARNEASGDTRETVTN